MDIIQAISLLVLFFVVPVALIVKAFESLKKIDWLP